jgi:hypothetical protein
MEVINNKYHNGKIYTIRSHQTDKYYIGSTCQALHKRLYKHRLNYKNYLNGTYPNMSSYNIIIHNDNYIELLEEVICENNEQLTKREGELIREHKDNCVNIKIEGRTIKEWINDNKETITLNQKIYRDEHKGVQRQWKVDNCLHVTNYNNDYYNKNKIAVCAKRKENYIKNKDKRTEAMLVKRAIISICECGLEIKLYDKLRHTKSKKHLESMNNLIN